ncbi:TATA-binding protein-associated factor 2N-like [Penaeus indicus]|uniref:TATA-binding protein-associated factor 2N-like n=1 Tax=Penaeus indicus TaxID=29960 RepID=UPI00300D931C
MVSLRVLLVLALMAVMQVCFAAAWNSYGGHDDDGGFYGGDRDDGHDGHDGHDGYDGDRDHGYDGGYDDAGHRGW